MVSLVLIFLWLNNVASSFQMQKGTRDFLSHDKWCHHAQSLNLMRLRTFCSRMWKKFSLTGYEWKKELKRDTGFVAAEDSKWEDEEIMRCCLMRLLCKHKKGTKGYDLVPSKVGHGSREDKDNTPILKDLVVMMPIPSLLCYTIKVFQEHTYF